MTRHSTMPTIHFPVISFSFLFQVVLCVSWPVVTGRWTVEKRTNMKRTDNGSGGLTMERRNRIHMVEIEAGL